MQYRRNSDEELRELERQWRQSNSAEDLELFNRARARSGLPELTLLKLEWGYHPALPPTATAAWGARMLIEHGQVNLLHDRQSLAAINEEEKRRLRELLNGDPAGTGIIASIRTEAARLLQAGLLRSDEAREFLLYDDPYVAAFGNSNASYGHFYVVVFLKPSDWVTPGTGIVCERCGADAGGDFSICVQCHKRICCGDQCEYCQGWSCPEHAEYSRCDLCEQEICNSPQCQRTRRITECRTCGRIRCFDCRQARCPCEDEEVCDDCGDVKEECNDCGELYCSCTPCPCAEEDEEEEDEEEEDEDEEEDGDEEDEEDLEQNPAPARRGRNDPCPCGSGKKYKKCCLKTDMISRPSLRQKGEPPQPGMPASPVGGETVLMCIHTGIKGHVDPSRKIGKQPQPGRLHFYWTDFNGQRPDGTTFHANWIGICDKCEKLGSPGEAPITGDYLWPEEVDDAPPLIFPPGSGDYESNPLFFWNGTKVVISHRVEKRLRGTCFRGKREAGCFIRWRDTTSLFAAPEVKDRFLREAAAILQEIQEEDRKTDKFSFTIALSYPVGWSSTIDFGDLPPDVSLVEKNLNKHSTAMFVTDPRIPAPLTRLITFVCSFKLPNKIAIQSIYPGKDVGSLKGNLTDREGVVFFDWTTPGEKASRRKNPDEELRDLERRASAGDADSRSRYLHSQLRSGQITSEEFLMKMAAAGDVDSIRELTTSGRVHESLICKRCNRLMEDTGKSFWGATYKCGGCSVMYKVHCGQLMNTYGYSRMGPGRIECRVCDYEKDFG